MVDHAIADLIYLEKSLSSVRIEETGTYTYIGKCLPENYDSPELPVWQISRFDDTSGEGMQFADNSRTANKIWNDRSTYFS